jgi:hypothetical protein
VKEYPTVLRAILESTPKTHSDYKLSFRALLLLEDIVSNVEYERKILENNAKILQVEAMIEGNHVRYKHTTPR